MMTSQIDASITKLDRLRKEPKKFVCLNDNMDHGTRFNKIKRTTLTGEYKYWDAQ